ncbi:MAG: 23S rRNA (uracil(1939)-C(5))-methyltransferase RlmD [Bacilli bacterium]
MFEKEHVIVECQDFNHQGQGVCKLASFPLFVDFLLIGEKAEIEITKLTKNYGFGKIIKLLEKSEKREIPKCSAFGKCGGCEIMHMSYPAQLAFKKQMSINTLKKIGHLTNLPLSGIMGMENPYYYRNKVQIPFQKKNNDVVCGFFQKNSHIIYPMKECFIQPTEATQIALFICDFANKYHLSPYDEKTHTGILRHVLIRNNQQNEFIVVIVTNSVNFPNKVLFVSKITEQFPQVRTIVQNINIERTNVVLGNKNIVWSGMGFLNENLLGLSFTISPHSFFHTNYEQTKRLYEQVLKYADPKPSDTIVDGYCGVGTIACFLAKSCKKVIGIEIVKEAIKDAKGNAVINSIENVEFIVGKTEDEIKNFKSGDINIIVVDPPRKGCDRQLLEAIKLIKIPKVIYVSCDVATLARDLECLVSDYEIKDMTFFDMFPQTCDVETCVLLALK